MFTLCMSRTTPHRESINCKLGHKQIKGGYLLRYRRGLFCKNWSEEWMVLYEDSTIAWYADQSMSRVKGYVRISDAPDLLAVAEYTAQVPHRPRIPDTCQIGQLLAIGTKHSSYSSCKAVHWLLAQSPAELTDWMTAISNTLPPPNKRLSITSRSNICILNGTQTSQANGKTPGMEDADHTAVSALAIDWGHGWGWGHAAWTAHSACLFAQHSNAAVVPSAGLFYNTGEDFGIGGYEEVDWSSFDFTF